MIDVWLASVSADRRVSCYRSWTADAWLTSVFSDWLLAVTGAGWQMHGWPVCPLIGVWAVTGAGRPEAAGGAEARTAPGAGEAAIGRSVLSPPRSSWPASFYS